MSGSYRLTKQAVIDLEDIWEFIALDDPLAADHFIEELLNVAQRLAGAPRIGRQRKDLLPGLRSLPHGRYLIFYRVVQDTVEICRVLHGSRDLPTLF